MPKGKNRREAKGDRPGRRNVTQSTTRPFLSVFPPEVRLEIYRNILVAHGGVVLITVYEGRRRTAERPSNEVFFQVAPSFESIVWGGFNELTTISDRRTATNIHTAILRTCKTIYSEPVEVLYEYNMFVGRALACMDDRDNWPRVNSIKHIGISYKEFLMQDLAFPHGTREITIFAWEQQQGNFYPGQHPEIVHWEQWKGEDDKAWTSRLVKNDPQFRKFMDRLTFLRKGGVRTVNLHDFRNETLKREIQRMMGSTAMQGVRSNKFDAWSAQYVSRLPDGTMPSGVKAWHGPGTRMDGSRP